MTSKPALYRKTVGTPTRLFIGALVTCGIALSLATAYLGVRWRQARQQPIPINMGLCNLNLTPDMSPAEITQACPPDPLTTINHTYERGMAETGLSAAGFFVAAGVLNRRHRSVRERIIRSHGLR